MKTFLLALCALSLAACGGDSTTTTNKDAAGGLDGMPLEQLAELGLECEGGMYPELRKIDEARGLCLPDIEQITPLINDCKLIAEAGCLPVALGCGYMATAMSLSIGEGLDPRTLEGYERQAIDTKTLWMAPDRETGELTFPAMGDDRQGHLLKTVADGAHDCIRDIRPELSELGQWVWRDAE